jgi:hypothetical protein
VTSTSWAGKVDASEPRPGACKLIHERWLHPRQPALSWALAFVRRRHHQISAAERKTSVMNHSSSYSGVNSSNPSDLASASDVILTGSSKTGSGKTGDGD